MSKRLACMFAAILVLSSMVTVQVVASDFQPPIPEFTVRYVAYSEYFAPTYTIDPYTGEQQVDYEGGYENMDYIEIQIRNPPFTPHQDSRDNDISVFYNVRVRPHWGQWQTYPRVSASGYWEASNSEYTTVTFPKTQGIQFVEDGKIDFAVQALIGYQTVTWALIPPVNENGDLTAIYKFYGDEGSWSNTKTVTVGSDVVTESTPEPTVTAEPTPPPATTQPTATATPTATETVSPTQAIDQNSSIAPDLIVVVIAAMAVVIAVLASALVFSLQRRRLPPPPPT